MTNEYYALKQKEYRERNANNPEYKARKAAADKKYREENKERLSAAAKLRYLENPEVAKERVKKYASENQEKIKEYRVENKEKRNKQSRDWYQNNQDKVLEYRAEYNEENAEILREKSRLYAKEHPEISKAWRAANPEKVKAVDKRMRVKHKDKIYAKNSKRRALLKGAKVELVKREVVYERDKGICGLCKQLVDFEQMTLDHILPLSLGGEHSYANVQVAHLSCNSSKGNRI